MIEFAITGSAVATMILKLFRRLIWLIAFAGIGFFLFSRQDSLPPATPPQANAFDTETLQRGANLARLGNCEVCHTKPGGKPFAGGLAIPTGFGAIYSTNITPDAETGIGMWSEAAFTRALRQGVDRDGNHLYPAFPYDHFTLLSDRDAHALYAYAMTRGAVKAPSRANELSFPFNIRAGIALWKALYFKDARYRPDPARGEEWNRGAYLAEGISHCGACHTPRVSLGGETKSAAYDGAPVEGWYAYALNEKSPAPVPWTEQALQFYLSHGWHEHHGISRGPMAPVTMNLATAPAADVNAIATYIASVAGTPSEARRVRGEKLIAAAKTSTARSATADSLANPDSAGRKARGQGEPIYRGACATCHESGRPLPLGGLNLALSSALNGPNPYNVINVTLFGLPQQPGNSGPVMPGFHGSLTDEQLTALLTYLRERFSTKPPWSMLEKDIKDARSGARPSREWPAQGSRVIASDSSQEMGPW